MQDTPANILTPQSQSKPPTITRAELQRRHTLDVLRARLDQYPASEFGDSALKLNTVTGIIETVPVADLGFLQEYELVLRKMPKSSCRQCHGRGVSARNPIQQSWIVCPRCSRTMIDFHHATVRAIQEIEKQVEPSTP